MKILIGGDFCITSPYLDKKLIDDDIVEIFEKADFRIINLECPVTTKDAKNKIEKTGPHIKTNDEIFKYLCQLKIDVVTLANNHILDYGDIGIQNTINSCKKNNIEFVGAGLTNAQVSAPLIIEKDGYKIAIINFCENEWSISRRNAPGANPIDIVENYNQIKYAKQLAEVVIVVIHGGHEYYSFPSPRMVKQYRFFAENGADAIIGHHTHCISGYEIYKNVPIVYSLGNFIFTMHNTNDKWYSGLIAELELGRNMKPKINLIPIKQSFRTFKTSLAKKIDKDRILADVKRFSDVIVKSDSLEREWANFLQDSRRRIELLSPSNSIPNKYLVGVINRIGINRLLLNKRYLKNIINNFRCEAHKDILIQLIEDKICRK